MGLANGLFPSGFPTRTLYEDGICNKKCTGKQEKFFFWKKYKFIWAYTLWYFKGACRAMKFNSSTSRQCMHNITEARSSKLFALEKQCVLHTLSVSLALVILHAKAHELYCMVIWCRSGSTIFFPHYLINSLVPWKKLLNTKCVIWFCLKILSETILIPRRILRTVSQMYVNLRLECPLFLSDFDQNWIFLIGFRNARIC